VGKCRLFFCRGHC